METVKRIIVKLDKHTSAKLLIDNVVVYWCLIKGRSHVKDLNDLIKQIGVVIAERQLNLKFHWVRSEDNLADKVNR